MVTFLSATVRAIPARKAVKPARAPLDKSRPATGIFTVMDVIFTMRPNPFAAIESITCCIRLIGVSIFIFTPSIMAFLSSWRKSFNGGPALLFTKISGSGQAASSAICPSSVLTSAATGITDTPVDSSISFATRASRCSFKPLITRLTPASASACAQARPRPRLDAHTMACFPLIPKSMPCSCNTNQPSWYLLLKRLTVTSVANFSQRIVPTFCRLFLHILY